MKRRLLITFSIIAFALILIASITLKKAAEEIEIARVQLADFQSLGLPGASQVFDDGKKVIATTGAVFRLPVDSSKLPKHVVDAFLAAEDDSFFNHRGISVSGIIRAIYINLKAGKVVQGASTITQQVVKQLFLSPERSMGRKIREQALAVVMERKLTKYQILDLYLAIIYFGKGAYGIEAASRIYFGKPASLLNISESALLAGIPKSPVRYSPHINPDRAEERRKKVLNLMFECGFISRKNLRDSIESLPSLRLGWERFKGPHGVLRAIPSEVQRILPVAPTDQGVKIYLTYSAKSQAKLEAALSDFSKQISPDKRKLYEFAGLTMGVDGSLKAMKGASDEEAVFYNYVSQMKRPLGRFILPVLAELAFQDGANWASSIRYWQSDDNKVPSIYSVFKNGDFYPMSSLVDKLGASGIESGLNKVGLTSRYRDIRIAAGFDEVNLLQIARLGTSWVRGGSPAPRAFWVKRIESYDGSILFEKKLNRFSPIDSSPSYELLKAGLVDSSPCGKVVCYISHMKNDGNFYAMVLDKSEVSVLWFGSKYGQSLVLQDSQISNLKKSLLDHFQNSQELIIDRNKISYYKKFGHKYPFIL